ncbi:dehydratase [Chelativorans sp. ZYF759]|uniref:MaoC/PaaZ C-terminal domain-containing protein n=1 Tax=Chelativorans sp. ZYF759 TaxID=2692213 RepID=UPI00145CB864|nr:MaoC/PaaZ C-terminal domain-containing protein [Chelativorans sp. ZYF759]NMG39712.1 dehydratase [Chelativorans sp. ZYF759]
MSERGALDHFASEKLNALLGQEYVSPWRVIDQETVNHYAVVSGDGEGEWIHLDPERAAREGPYAGTIVPGFLQVANLTRLHGETVRGFGGFDPNHILNYGFDRLRFVAPLPVGASFRARIRISEIRPRSEGVIIKQDVALEREDGTPTLVGEWLFYLTQNALQGALEAKDP